MNRLAVFDCDGTLVDSQAAICAAMAVAFERAGLPCPPDAVIRRSVGLSPVEAMRALHPAGDAAAHQRIAGDYKLAFRTARTAGMVAEPLFDGILDCLAALDGAGWLLGVATGKSDRGLALCLAHHGIAGRFVTLQTADRHPSKPHPAMLHAAIAEAGAAPESTVMIGDTCFDIAMAKAAGATAIGVAWGYHSAQELMAEGADHVAADLADLVRIIARS